MGRQMRRLPLDDEMGVRGEVVAVLRRASGRVETYRTRNIVTDAGDLYYAQRGANETTTNFTNGSNVFDGVMELATVSGTPLKTDNRSNVSGLVSGSQAAMTSGYPKSDDTGNAENTGAAVDSVTYKATWAAGVATSTAIASVIITNPSPGASEPLLMYAKFSAAFDKGAGDSLTVYVNHNMLGV